MRWSWFDKIDSDEVRPSDVDFFVISESRTNGHIERKYNELFSKWTKWEKRNLCDYKCVVREPKRDKFKLRFKKQYQYDEESEDSDSELYYNRKPTVYDDTYEFYDSDSDDDVYFDYKFAPKEEITIEELLKNKKYGEVCGMKDKNEVHHTTTCIVRECNIELPNDICHVIGDVFNYENVPNGGNPTASNALFMCTPNGTTVIGSEHGSVWESTWGDKDTKYESQKYIINTQDIGDFIMNKRKMRMIPIKIKRGDTIIFIQVPLHRRISLEGCSIRADPSGLIITPTQGGGGRCREFYGLRRNSYRDYNILNHTFENHILAYKGGSTIRTDYDPFVSVIHFT